MDMRVNVCVSTIMRTPMKLGVHTRRMLIVEP